MRWLLVFMTCVLTVSKTWGTHELLYASLRGDVERVRMLLARGDDVDYTDWCGDTALHYAAHRGNLAVVQALLAAGACGCVANRIGLTACDFAERRGHVSIAYWIGAYCYAHDIDDEVEAKIALIDAVRTQDEMLVAALLDSGVTPNLFVDYVDDYTLLHEACFAGDANIVERLLKARVRLHRCTFYRGLTAMHYAASNGHSLIIEKLANAGMSVNRSDHDGITPLQWASMGGHHAACELLIRLGARAS